MKTWQKILFGLILIFALGVRFYRLGEIPEGFHSDEAAFGYNAYSILKTGNDEYGKPFPLILKSFGDDKPALYSYITTPFVALFGLTEQAIRLPSAVFGVLAVLAVYICAYAITKKKDISVLAAIICALSPSFIVQSRVQSNPIISFVMLLFAIAAYMKWVQKKKMIWLGYSFVCLIISSFCYLTPQHFMPLFLPYIVIRDRKKYSPGMRIGLIFYIIAFLGIVGWQALAGGSRYGQVSIIANPSIILPLEEQIREDGVAQVPPLVTRAFHNKAYAYANYMAMTLKEYLSYDFLFHEAQQPLRERIPSMGMFYVGEFFLLCIGLVSFIRKPPSYGGVLIAWFIASVAGLLLATDETPNVHRFLMAMFPFFICIAEGIRVFIVWCTRRNFFHRGALFGWFVISLMYISSVLFFIHQLFVHQPIHFPFYRAYAYKPLVERMKDRSQAYDVVVSQKVLEHMLFFWPMDPLEYQRMGSPRDEDEHWMGKYFFVSDPCPSHSIKYTKMMEDKKVLYIDKAECRVPDNDILETIRWRDNSAAFYLVESKEPEQY